MRCIPNAKACAAACRVTVRQFRRWMKPTLGRFARMAIADPRGVGEVARLLADWAYRAQVRQTERRERRQRRKLDRKAMGAWARHAGELVASVLP